MDVTDDEHLFGICNHAIKFGDPQDKTYDIPVLPLWLIND